MWLCIVGNWESEQAMAPMGEWESGVFHIGGFVGVLWWVECIWCWCSNLHQQWNWNPSSVLCPLSIRPPDLHQHSSPSLFQVLCLLILKFSFLACVKFSWTRFDPEIVAFVGVFCFPFFIYFTREDIDSGDVETRDSYSESCSDESESDKLSSRWDGCSSEEGGSEQESLWQLNSKLGYLYCQYFERSAPYIRLPLKDKVLLLPLFFISMLLVRFGIFFFCFFLHIMFSNWFCTLGM